MGPRRVRITIREDDAVIDSVDDAAVTTAENVADALMTKLDHNGGGGGDGGAAGGGGGDGGGVDVKIGEGMDIAIHGENGETFFYLIVLKRPT